MKSRLTHLQTGVVTDSNQIRVSVHSPAKHTEIYPACFEPMAKGQRVIEWSIHDDEEVIWKFIQRKK